MAWVVPASAAVVITIDKSAQRMSVKVDGVQKYYWPVSTGGKGYTTPSGSYTTFRMEKEHFSKEWDDAPMPYSIFFTHQGHAIHGSNSRLGVPLSHGCVRLSPQNAATLFALVDEEGALFDARRRRRPRADRERQGDRQERQQALRQPFLHGPTELDDGHERGHLSCQRDAAPPAAGR